VIVRPEGLASRIAASGWIVWFHLYKIFLPINLAMVYPRWDVDGGRVISFVPLGLLIACFAVLWYYRKSWARGPLAAAAYFVLAMGPLLGFVDVAFMKHSLVADHFQYAAMPAVIALVSGLLAYPLTRTGARRSSVTWAAGAAVICAVVLTLGTLTWRQAQLYRDEESLWTHTIALNNRAWVAYNNRGIAYAKRGLGDRALQDYDKAIALEPDRAQSWNNRGNACREMGDFSQAIHDYTKAIELEPDSAGAYYNRANAYNTRGDYREAISDHTKAIELRPDFMDAYNNRAIAHFYLKEYEKAWADVRVVKRLGGQPTPDLISALTEATGRTE
jgi:tetratricopeptide (TPR) repeat protein